MRNDNHSAQFQLLAFTSIGFTLLLLVLLVYIFDDNDRRSITPIKIVTGDWAPYSSATLPEYGMVTAIVTRVLSDIGYKAEYQFMPWPAAEKSAASAETNAGIRGTFPYIDYRDDLTAEDDRSSRFYFSDALMETEFGVFYDSRQNKLAAEISEPSDLAQHTVITIDGYNYSLPFRPYMTGANTLSSKDNYQAFKMLVTADPSLVVIESVDVGLYLIDQQFPAMLPFIKLAPIRMSHDMRLMFSKRNPNNLSLKRDFNRQLAKFKSNTEAFNRFLSEVKNQLDMSRAVQLEPINGEQFIYAFQDLQQKQAVLLPRGSRAIILNWNIEFLDFQAMPLDTRNSLVKIKLLNGPFADKKAFLYVNAGAIRLHTP